MSEYVYALCLAFILAFAFGLVFILLGVLL